jgi:hypothetical protein
LPARVKIVRVVVEAVAVSAVAADADLVVIAIENAETVTRSQ